MQKGKKFDCLYQGNWKFVTKVTLLSLKDLYRDVNDY